MALRDDAERRRSRMMKCAHAAMQIAQRSGGLSAIDRAEEIRVAALAAIAETRSLWFFLIERGMATEAQRQDYLDKGYDDMLRQVDEYLGTLVTVAGERPS
jgi:hypothetical protein